MNAMFRNSCELYVLKIFNSTLIKCWRHAWSSMRKFFLGCVVIQLVAWRWFTRVRPVFSAVISMHMQHLLCLYLKYHKYCTRDCNPVRRIKEEVEIGDKEYKKSSNEFSWISNLFVLTSNTVGIGIKGVLNIYFIIWIKEGM